MEEVQERLERVELNEPDSIQVITRKMDLKQKVFFFLIGKVLSRKFEIGVVRRLTKKVWRLDNPYKIEEIKDSRVLFTFRSLKDRDKVFEGGPWHCDKSLMVVVKTSGLEDPSTVPMVIRDFWVEFHGLPPLLLTKSMGIKIGEYLGSVSSVDVTADHMSPYSFLRARIALEVAKPLKRFAIVSMKYIDKKFDVEILYEKLPNICYVCGRLNHLMDDCHLLTSDDQSKEVECLYGDWLAAPEFRKKVNPNRNWIVTEELKNEIKHKRKFEDTEIIFDESDTTEWVKKSKPNFTEGSSSSQFQWNATSLKKKKDESIGGMKKNMESRRGRGRSGRSLSCSLRGGASIKAFGHQQGLIKLQKSETPPYAAVVGGSLIPIPQTTLLKVIQPGPVLSLTDGSSKEKGKQIVTQVPISFASVVAGVKKQELDKTQVSRKLVMEDDSFSTSNTKVGTEEEMGVQELKVWRDGKVTEICNSIEASTQSAEVSERQDMVKVMSDNSFQKQFVGTKGTIQKMAAVPTSTEATKLKAPKGIIAKAITDAVKLSSTLGTNPEVTTGVLASGTKMDDVDKVALKILHR